MSETDKLTFAEYQVAAQYTANYPVLYMKSIEDGQEVEHDVPFVYPALGLAGEQGEAIEKLKKVIRDSHGVVSPETKELLKFELGDYLWYISQIATELGIPLQEVAQGNIDKLRDRKNRNVIHGVGDKR